VDLPVGEDDLRVTAAHGERTFRKRQWWLRNTATNWSATARAG